LELGFDYHNLEVVKLMKIWAAIDMHAILQILAI